MTNKKPNLTNAERNKIAQFLLQHSVGGKPKRGKMSEAAALCGVSRRTASTIWKEANEQIKQGLPIFISSKKPGAVHNNKIVVDIVQIMQCKPNQRTTVRKLAGALKEKGIRVCKSTVHNWIKQGLLRDHSNAIKPDLTAPNKLLRLKFSLSHIHFDRILGILKFKSMQHVVHIDEKWFYITKTTQRYYLAPEETEPHRTCKSKRFITKVMFVCAVARPVYSPSGELVWDGKIGMFPLVTYEPAKRKSKNRVRGTLETKPIQAVTKEVYKSCLINQVIPAIKEKWPIGASKSIRIQQDNARPHITNLDPEFRNAATSNGFDIELVNQPPNSPDTNINDLGWFRALQSLSETTTSYNVDDLVRAVEMSFINLTDTTLNKVFLSLQNCMIEILKVRGQNNYKVPHMGKDRLIRENRLPQDLQVDKDLVRGCIEYLVMAGDASEMVGLMTDLGVHEVV